MRSLILLCVVAFVIISSVSTVTDLVKEDHYHRCDMHKHFQTCMALSPKDGSEPEVFDRAALVAQCTDAAQKLSRIVTEDENADMICEGDAEWKRKPNEYLTPIVPTT